MIAAGDALQTIAGAANFRTGGNPAYGAEDFLAMYPQFGLRRRPDETDGMLLSEVVPLYVMDAWIKIAHASIHKNRYHELWEMAMGLFVAHYLTLYLRTAAKPGDPVGKILSAGIAKGLQTAKSAGDLSTSYDFSTVAKDFDGWGTYKETAFGQQFITLAKLAGMGGMGVW